MRWLTRRQLVEESKPLVTTAHDVHNGREPVLVLRFDPQLAFPLRVEQVGVRPGQLGASEQLRVVCLHPHRKQRRRPLFVHRNGAGLEVRVEGHVDRLVESLRPWDSGRRYLNFAETPGDPRAIFGRGYERLRQIRERVDPNGLFVSNHPV